MAKREYTEAELQELVRTVRAAREAPRGPWIARVWFLVICASLLAIFASMVAIFVTDPRNVRTLGPVVGAAILMLVLGYFAGGYVRRRFKRRVLARAGLVCPNCHYELPTYDESGQTMFCPECREPYKPEELRRIWEGWSPGMVWWE